jgi:uncharacterized protein (DUF3084 family)
MKLTLFLFLLSFITSCQDEELNALRTERAAQKNLVDSLQKQLDNTDRFKSQVIKDFGESSQKLQERLDEVEKLRQNLQATKSIIDLREKRIDTLLAANRLKEKEINFRQKELDSQSDFIKTLNTRIDKQDELAKSLHKTITDRDESIKTLNKTISDRDGNLSKLNRRIAEQDETIRILQSKPEPKSEKKEPEKKEPELK